MTEGAMDMAGRLADVSVRGIDQDRALKLGRKAAWQIVMIVRSDNSATSAECRHLPQTSRLSLSFLPQSFYS
jgi:hypothetical protein